MWQKRASQLTSGEGIRGLIWVISLNVTGQFTHPSPSWVFHRANIAHRLMIFTPPIAITVFKKIAWMEGDIFLVWWRWVTIRQIILFLLILGGQGDHEDLQVLCLGRINNVCILCTPPYKFPYYTFWRGIPRKPSKVYIPQLWSSGTRRNPSSRVRHSRICRVRMASKCLLIPRNVCEV